MPSKTAQPASSAKPATSPKLPVKTFRLGRIKAAVWENEADQKKIFNVTFARTYMDEARIEALGAEPLKPALAKIAGIDSREALSAEIGATMRADGTRAFDPARA